MNSNTLAAAILTTLYGVSLLASQLWPNYVRNPASRDYTLQLLLALIVAVTSLLSSLAMRVFLPWQRRPALPVAAGPNGPSIYRIGDVLTRSLSPSAALFISCLCAGCMGYLIQEFGIRNLMLRDYYLEHLPTGNVALALATLVCRVLPFACALILFYTRASLPRLMAGVALCLFVFYTLGRGSRLLSVGIAEILFACELRQRTEFAKWSERFVCAFLSVFALGFLLDCRHVGNYNTGEYGIVPSLHNFASFSHDASRWTNAFSYVVANLTTFPSNFERTWIDYHDARSLEYLWMALSPMPGSMAGWTSEAREMRLSVYEPYNSLAELAVWGLPVVGAFYFAVGTIFVLDEWIVQRSDVAPLAIRSLAGFSMVIAPQYNLRTQCRVVYATLLVAILAYCIESAIIDRRTAPRD
jgi:hypothetical protein